MEAKREVVQQVYIYRRKARKKEAWKNYTWVIVM
jgi:hypothetical protein